MAAGPGGEFGIASCGREDASSGTEGSYDIYDGGTKVCTVYWDCPWGLKRNSFETKNVNKDYTVQDSGANLDSGAIGTVTIKVFKAS
jgi:hypothetical protein